MPSKRRSGRTIERNDSERFNQMHPKIQFIGCKNIMGKKFNLNSLMLQYLIGLAVNLVFLAILLNSDTAYRNVQLPEGEYLENAFKGTDVGGYVRPARSYLESGVFSQRKGVPDYIRTIGFPLYLAMMMKLFGSNWLIWAFFAQAALYACIYPALSKIIQTLFPKNHSITTPVFCFCLCSGAYVTLLPAVLTDLFFTVFFTIGLCFGFLSIAKQSWKHLFLYLLFVGYAAQVRPTLVHYPIVNVFVLWLVAKRYNVLSLVKIKAIIIISSAVLLFACNAPSIRNYVHHGFFKPTIILEQNFFNHVVGYIMADQNELVTFEEMRQKVDATNDLIERMSLQKKFTVEACTKYPAVALKCIVRNSLPILANSYWIFAGSYWGYHRQDITSPNRMHLKKSNFLFVIFVMGCVVYMVVDLFFMYFLYHLARGGNWLFFFTILLLIGPILAASFIIPGPGARMRLPVEGIIVMCSFYGISLTKYFNAEKDDRIQDQNSKTR